MVLGDGSRHGQEVAALGVGNNGIQNVGPVNRVDLHHSNSLAVEPSRLEQNRVADRHLADIVQGAGAGGVAEELLVDLPAVTIAFCEFLGEHPGIAADPDHVLARLLVPRLGHSCDGENGHVLESRRSAVLDPRPVAGVPRGEIGSRPRSRPGGRWPREAQVQLNFRAENIGVHGLDHVGVGPGLEGAELLFLDDAAEIMIT